MLIKSEKFILATQSADNTIKVIMVVDTREQAMLYASKISKPVNEALIILDAPYMPSSK